MSATVIRNSTVAPHPTEPEDFRGLAVVIVHRLTRLTPLSVGIYLGLAAGFMMCFLQGDILYNSFVANQMTRGHLDVYSWFSDRSGLRKIDTVMPPLYYVLTAIYLKLLSLIHLNPVAYNPKNLFTNVFHTHMGLRLMFGLLLMKLPNLVAVVAGVWATWQLARLIAETDSRLAVFLWVASPALIVSALMQAQNDSIAAAMTIFALLAFQRGNRWQMFALLGLAACFKTYPLVVALPAALLLCNRNILRAAAYGIISALPLALVSLPFLGGAYMSRVFGAHDGNTLLGTQYDGRMPVHLWALGYVLVLGLAWYLSNRQIDVTQVALLWFLPLSLVFVVNWWVPQWSVWLLPTVVLVASRDRLFAWLWVITNLAVMVVDVLLYPGNMDGAMLEPFYGDRRHPSDSHFYNFHLFHIWKHVPYAVLDGSYIVCGGLFLLLVLRAAQLITARTNWSGIDCFFPRLPDVYWAALAGPALLVPYIGTMIVQRLVG